MDTTGRRLYKSSYHALYLPVFPTCERRGLNLVNYKWDSSYTSCDVSHTGLPPLLLLQTRQVLSEHLKTTKTVSRLEEGL